MNSNDTRKMMMKTEVTTMEHRITDDRITLDYGSGGSKTSELIESILLPAFDNTTLSSLGDGAVVHP